MTVYAQTRFAGLTPPVVGSAYEKPQSAYGLSAVFLRTFLRLLKTYGFLYRNRKIVIYSRNVMRNGGKNFCNFIEN
jgi:hypothetical protein